MTILPLGRAAPLILIGSPSFSLSVFIIYSSAWTSYLRPRQLTHPCWQVNNPLFCDEFQYTRMCSELFWVLGITQVKHPWSFDIESSYPSGHDHCSKKGDVQSLANADGGITTISSASFLSFFQTNLLLPPYNNSGLSFLSITATEYALK